MRRMRNMQFVLQLLANCNANKQTNTIRHTHINMYVQHMTGDILPGLQFVVAVVAAVVNIHLQRV